MSDDMIENPPSLIENFAPENETPAIDLSLNPEPLELNNVHDIKTKSILAIPITRGNPIEHDHWSGNDKYTPYGYKLTDKGVVKLSEDDSKLDVFCGPIYVCASTANPEGNDGGLVLEFENMRKRYITISIPRTRLHEEPRILAQDLASQNFAITPGKEKELLIYLSKCVPSEERISVTQTGWAHSNDPDKLVYVLPDSSTEPGYHFQPDRFSPTAMSCRQSGELKDWIDNVFAAGSIDGTPGHYPLFAVLVALTGPLIKAAGIDSGGCHFFGGSSSGKTTLAQIASSVWGNGADPSDAPNNPFTKRWNATLNAMEGLAAGANDMLLVLDELGSCNAKDFGRAVYDLSGGQGKSAMDASRNMRKQRSWRIPIISTGEVSSQSKIEEAASAFRSGRSHAKAGQMIRLIDIEVNQNMFKSRAQVDSLKRACAQYYGTLGPAFVNAIVAKFTSTSLRRIIQDNLDQTLNRLISSQGKVNAIQQRALRRFAMAETSGHLLVYLKVIPNLTNDTVRKAITTVVEDWMPRSVGLSDGERAITALKEFILKYRDTRFKERTEFISLDKDRLSREIAGYYDQENGNRVKYYLLPEAFKEATGSEPRMTAAVLREQKYLITDRADRNTCRISVDGQQIAVYGVKSEILGD